MAQKYRTENLQPILPALGHWQLSGEQPQESYRDDAGDLQVCTRNLSCKFLALNHLDN